jgi:hypothetical protein
VSRPPLLPASLLACFAAALTSSVSVIFLVGSPVAGNVHLGDMLLICTIVFVVAAVVAAAHVAIFAVPLFLLLNRFYPVGILASSAAGTLIGIAPLSLFYLLFGTRSVDETSLMLGVPGFAGGLAFGLVIHRKKRRRLTRRDHDGIFG